MRLIEFPESRVHNGYMQRFGYGRSRHALPTHRKAPNAPARPRIAFWVRAEMKHLRRFCNDVTSQEMSKSSIRFSLIEFSETVRLSCVWCLRFVPAPEPPPNQKTKKRQHVSVCSCFPLCASLCSLSRLVLSCKRTMASSSLRCVIFSILQLF